MTNQEAEVDRSLVKIIALGVVSVALAFLFGYALSGFLVAGSFRLLITAVVAAIFFLALSIFQSFFIKSGSIAALIILLESSVMVAAFYKNFSFWIVLGALFLFLLLLGGYRWGSKELKNIFKVHFFHVGRPIAARASTALLVFVTIAYLGSLNFSDPSAAKGMIKGMIQPMEPLIARIVGQLLPPGAGMLIKPNQLVSAELMTDFIYQATIAKILLLPKLFQNLILLGIGLLSLKSFAFIVNYLVLFAAYILYQILKAAGFFYISLESRSKEVIILK